MSVRKSALASLLFIAFAAPGAAHAQDAKPWSLGVKAGVSYYDNVTLDQLDLKSGVGDTIGNLALSAGYKLVDSKTNSLAVSYDFSQSLHAKLTNFDIQSHSIGLSGSSDFGDVSLGLSWNFYHMLLGGKRFLDMHVVNPSISGFVTQNIYLRGYYFYFDKSFYTAVSRDASNHQPGMTAYYFFNQSKSYVSLDAHYEIGNTSAPQYDYKGYAIGASLEVPVDLAVRTAKVQLGYTYLHRDYDNITPSLGVRRYETRSTLRASAEIPLVDKFDFTLDYRYIDRNSNLLTTKYTENVGGGTLSYDF